MDEDSLVLGEKLGSGGQGTVHRVSGGPCAGLVYKRYTQAGPDLRALERLVEMPDSLTDTERARLFSLACWPLARVWSNGALTGFLMEEIPQRFVGHLKNGAPQLQEMVYLLYEPKPLWGGISPPDVQGRLELVRQYVSLFQLLHSRELVVGDISMANLLWSADDGGAVFILDCDGVRRPGEISVFTQGQTPGWEDPQCPQTGADLETDRYKLALLVGRVLGRENSVRPGDELRLLPGLPDRVADAVTQRFAEAGRGYGRRPDVYRWGVALGGRAEIPVDRPRPTPPVNLPLAKLQQPPKGPRKWRSVRPQGDAGVGT